MTRVCWHRVWAAVLTACVGLALYACHWGPWGFAACIVLCWLSGAGWATDVVVHVLRGDDGDRERRP